MHKDARMYEELLKGSEWKIANAAFILMTQAKSQADASIIIRSKIFIYLNN